VTLVKWLGPWKKPTVIIVFLQCSLFYNSSSFLG
jgi:hypothetical protein